MSNSGLDISEYLEIFIVLLFSIRNSWANNGSWSKQQCCLFISKPKDLISHAWLSFKDKKYYCFSIPFPHHRLLGRVWVQRPSRRAASLTCYDLSPRWILSHIPCSPAFAVLLPSTGNSGSSGLAIRATSLYWQALIGQVAGASLRLLNNSNRLGCV